MNTVAIRWIWVAFIVLVGLNVTLLGILYLDHLKPDSTTQNQPRRFNRRDARGFGMNPERVEKILREKVNFSDAQLKTFRTERDNHFQKTNQLRTNIHQSRSFLFELISQNEMNQPSVDSIIIHISKLEAEIDRANVEHFRAISAICTPEQRERYHSFIRDMSRALMPPRPPIPNNFPE